MSLRGEQCPTRQPPGTIHRFAPQEQTFHREIATGLSVLAITVVVFTQLRRLERIDKLKLVSRQISACIIHCLAFIDLFCLFSWFCRAMISVWEYILTEGMLIYAEGDGVI